MESKCSFTQITLIFIIQVLAKKLISSFIFKHLGLPYQITTPPTMLIKSSLNSVNLQQPAYMKLLPLILITVRFDKHT